MGLNVVFYPQNSKPRGFTLIEFLVALTLSAFLILVVYQVYSQVLEAYRRERENDFFKVVKITETLKWQLEKLACSSPKKAEFFYFKDGVLAFVTRFGPGGEWLVAYGPYPDQEEKSFYFETPYTGQKLPQEFGDFLAEKEKSFFTLPPFKFKLLKGEEEIEEVSHLEEGFFCLEVNSPQGVARRLCFTVCGS